MSDGSRFVHTMQKIAEPKKSQEVNVVFGVVTSIAPLKIKLDKIELTESFLILGALVKETTINVPTRDLNLHSHTVAQSVTGTSGADSHTHTVPERVTSEELPDILLWRGLEIGDVVYMLKCARGQQYLVLQREEGID